MDIARRPETEAARFPLTSGESDPNSFDSLPVKAPPTAFDIHPAKAGPPLQKKGAFYEDNRFDG